MLIVVASCLIHVFEWVKGKQCHSCVQCVAAVLNLMFIVAINN